MCSMEGQQEYFHYSLSHFLVVIIMIWTHVYFIFYHDVVVFIIDDAMNRQTKTSIIQPNLGRPGSNYRGSN